MSSLSFYAAKTLAALILPPAGPVLLALFFLLLCMKAKRPGWRAFTGTLAALSLLSLFALSIPVVATALTAPLNRYPVISDDALKQAQAIVILGGGTYYNAPEYGRDTVSGMTLQRVRYGVRLAKKTRLPILITGGTVYRGTPEGDSMRETLQEDFGLTPRWVEAAARNTVENASLSAAMLKKDGISKIALVSHSTHLARAVPLFQQQGLTVFPAPMGFVTRPPSWLEAVLPEGLSRSHDALHEYLGLLFNRLLRSGA
jgi:uncharacterized SAM-binding protein YcdF (DUF218 family)